MQHVEGFRTRSVLCHALSFISCFVSAGLEVRIVIYLSLLRRMKNDSSAKSGDFERLGGVIGMKISV